MHSIARLGIGLFLVFSSCVALLYTLNYSTFTRLAPIPVDKPAVPKPADSSAIIAEPADDSTIVVKPADDTTIVVKPAEDTTIVAKPKEDSKIVIKPTEPSHRSPGCGIEYEWAGKSIQNLTITSGGRERFYFVHLPANYDPTKETPVVVLYHAATGSADGFMRITAANDPAVNPNMITVAPQAINKRWQGAPYSPEGVDDLQLAADLVKRIKKDYCIDEDQVYTLGHSNGGGFISYLACTEYGNAYKAFAPISPTLYTEVDGHEVACDVPEMKPMLSIHCSGDKIAKYFGGERLEWALPGIPDWVRKWAKRNKCDRKPVTHVTKNGTDVSYTCGGRPNALRHYMVKDHGHAYLGREKGVNKDPFVTPAIMDWFASIGEGREANSLFDY